MLGGLKSRKDGLRAATRRVWMERMVLVGTD